MNSPYRLGIRQCMISLFGLVLCASCATDTTIDQMTSSRQRDFSVQESVHLDEPGCSLYVRRVNGSEHGKGPLFIAVNGVPTTSLIYRDLAQALVARLDATVLLVDFPGTGGSRLDGGHYSWTAERECLQAFLAQQPEHILVVHDLAGPVMLPLIGRIPGLRQVVVFNSVLKPSGYHPPFPLNCLRSCLFMSKPLAYAAPFWFYETRFRSIGIARNDRVSPDMISDIYDELRNDGGMGRLVDVMKGFELTEASDMAIAAGLAGDIPQLFIWGQQDPALGHELQALPPGRPHQQIHIIGQAKHFPMLDFTDESAQVIVEWYARTTNNPGG